jgi:hypothetical protein
MFINEINPLSTYMFHELFHGAPLGPPGAFSLTSLPLWISVTS